MLGRDMTPGCDNWAVKQGCIAVTPVNLRQDVPLDQVIALPAGDGKRQCATLLYEE